MDQAEDALLALLRRRDCSFMEVRRALHLTEGEARALLTRMTYACPGLYEYDVRPPGSRLARVRYGLWEGED